MLISGWHPPNQEVKFRSIRSCFAQVGDIGPAAICCSVWLRYLLWRLFKQRSAFTLLCWAGCFWRNKRWVSWWMLTLNITKVWNNVQITGSQKLSLTLLMDLYDVIQSRYEGQQPGPVWDTWGVFWMSKLLKRSADEDEFPLNISHVCGARLQESLKFNL